MVGGIIHRQGGREEGRKVRKQRDEEGEEDAKESRRYLTRSLVKKAT